MDKYKGDADGEEYILGDENGECGDDDEEILGDENEEEILYHTVSNWTVFHHCIFKYDFQSCLVKNMFFHRYCIETDPFENLKKEKVQEF